MQISQDDLALLTKKSIEITEVEKQITIFKRGIPYVKLLRAAIINDGIDRIPETELNNFASIYDASNAYVVKFVPASGAATRMFKLMHQFMEHVDSQESFDFLIKKDRFKELFKFAKQLPKLGLYPIIKAYLSKNDYNLKEQNYNQQAYLAFKAMLDKTQLGFADLPKGLVTFHRYTKDLETAFGEHFYEGLAYASRNGIVHLHFTISEEHQEKFDEASNRLTKKMREEYNVQFKVDYSYQETYTDTIAVDLNNQPFRLSNGSLFFRPGGHGSLIENLNKIDADLIFIKNIDNISHRNQLASNAFYKKILAGYLLLLQKTLFSYLERLENNPNDTSLFEEVVGFAKSRLHLQQKITSTKQLVNLLNRPLRVCGMVKNEGAPGGGPFWMENEENKTSLQIVEKSQIDTNDDKQNSILENSSHFNPVDIVCGVRNHKGEKFDLKKFVNHERGFITHKTVGAKEIKALEKPGLWNGGMELWNTVFVEVPSTTFSPVKAIVDLLNSSHLEKL